MLKKKLQVKDELVHPLGDNYEPIETKENFVVILLCGLQGSGKTTTSGKLANLLRKKYNRKPLLVACDIYRPAAIKQLEDIGSSLNIPVFTEDKKVLEIAQDGINYAKENNLDYVIIDTAGRLQIDEDLMNELKDIETNISN